MGGSTAPAARWMICPALGGPSSGGRFTYRPHIFMAMGVIV